MEYIVDQDGQIINLYKLKEGSVKTSCALPIAQSILLGPVACNRAEKVSNVRNTKTERFSIIMGHNRKAVPTVCFPKIHVSAIIVSPPQSFIFLHPKPIPIKIMYAFIV
jgi:DNA mismatch repair ATPase MutS